MSRYPGIDDKKLIKVILGVRKENSSNIKPTKFIIPDKDPSAQAKEEALKEMEELCSKLKWWYKIFKKRNKNEDNQKG